jgi:uncharacterized membrane protein AbrB (regulator of aidB expression)
LFDVSSTVNSVCRGFVAAGLGQGGCGMGFPKPHASQPIIRRKLLSTGADFEKLSRYLVKVAFHLVGWLVGLVKEKSKLAGASALFADAAASFADPSVSFAGLSASFPG